MARRLISAFLLLSFGLFTAEVAVADVHDGDATAGEIAKATTGSVDNASPDSVPDQAPDSRSHDVHVCHCIHGHGSIGAIAAVLTSLPLSNSGTPHSDLTRPTAVDRDVHVRPPIA